MTAGNISLQLCNPTVATMGFNPDKVMHRFKFKPTYMLFDINNDNKSMYYHAIKKLSDVLVSAMKLFVHDSSDTSLQAMQITPLLRSRSKFFAKPKKKKKSE
jgi:hypothetical protein